jgi:hypothetical protein
MRYGSVGGGFLRSEEDVIINGWHKRTDTYLLLLLGWGRDVAVVASSEIGRGRGRNLD